MPDPHSDTATTEHDEELATASVSLLAVVGLGLGILSVAAPIHPVLWSLPLLAGIVNVLALRRIRRYWPGLAGRPLAWLGLALAVVMGVAAPTHAVVRHWIATIEAQRFAAQFFELLRDDEPQQAYQLTLEPEVRQPFDEQLWAKYRASNERMQGLTEFVKKPAVRALLALGSRAEVRLYANENHEERTTQQAFINVYAVTYTDEAGQRQSFFVRLVLVRLRDRHGEMGWYVRFTGPVYPDNWPQSE